MSEEPKCETCRWFRLVPKDESMGACHRRAPVTQGRPITSTWDFCGEHEEKPRQAKSRVCADKGCQRGLTAPNSS